MSDCKAQLFHFITPLPLNTNRLLFPYLLLFLLHHKFIVDKGHSYVVYMLPLLLSHFSCVRLCATPPPNRRHPTRLPRPWDSPGKNTGVGCHSLLQCMKVKSERKVAQSCPAQQPHALKSTRLLHPWDFSRQEYWSGLPLSSPCVHEIS